MAKKKILIIDDETPVCRLLKFALEKTGLYETFAENDGIKAISSIRSVKPDLIILDVNMPEVNGAQIVVRMKEDASLQSLPVIFLTGNVSEEEAEAGLTISGYPAMAKPINMERLLQQIQKACNS